MIRLTLLAALAAALAGVVFFELQPASESDADAAGASGAQSPDRAQSLSPPPAAATADRQRWAEIALAHPLFNPSRRPSVEEAKPVEADAAAAAAAADLGRVAGIILLPGRSRAIFAGSGDGKPITVAEGDRLGPYVVEAISPGQVRLSGPDGTRLLRPSFDPTASAQTTGSTR